MVYLTPNPSPQEEGLQLPSAMPFSKILNFNRSLANLFTEKIVCYTFTKNRLSFCCPIFLDPFANLE